MFYFHPLFGEDEPILTSIFFQMCWFNQQPFYSFMSVFLLHPQGQPDFFSHQQLFFFGGSTCKVRLVGGVYRDRKR